MEGTSPLLRAIYKSWIDVGTIPSSRAQTLMIYCAHTALSPESNADILTNLSIDCLSFSSLIIEIICPHALSPNSWTSKISVEIITSVFKLTGFRKSF